MESDKSLQIGAPYIGRYQVVAGFWYTVLVDTESGRSWMLEVGMKGIRRWSSISFAQDASAAPKGTIP